MRMLKPERQPKKFNGEQLALLVLYLIKLNPKHGYELIKSFEDYSMGAYIPSSGVIYPLLTALEDKKYVRAENTVSGKKRYLASPEGIGYLDSHEEELNAALLTLRKMMHGISTQRIEKIDLAMENLKISLRKKLRERSLTDEEIELFCLIILNAASSIDKI